MLEYFVFVICQPYFLASNLFYIYFYFILQTENTLNVKKDCGCLNIQKEQSTMEEMYYLLANIQIFVCMVVSIVSYI